MTDQIKAQLEIAAENLSIEFQRTLINEISTEEGLVPLLMDLGSDPASYINIFSDEIIRLGAAYYKTINAWTELDEMYEDENDDISPEMIQRGIDSGMLIPIELEPDAFDEPSNRDNALQFPSEVRVDPYEQPDGDRHDRG